MTVVFEYGSVQTVNGLQCQMELMIADLAPRPFTGFQSAHSMTITNHQHGAFF